MKPEPRKDAYTDLGTDLQRFGTNNQRNGSKQLACYCLPPIEPVPKLFIPVHNNAFRFNSIAIGHATTLRRHHCQCTTIAHVNANKGQLASNTCHRNDFERAKS